MSIELFQEKTKVTDEQLNKIVEEIDFPNIADCCDDPDLYVAKFNLTPSEQCDVRKEATTKAKMMIALKFWRTNHPFEATFRALLQIMISLRKGEAAKQVCSYLLEKGKHSEHIIALQLLCYDYMGLKKTCEKCEPEKSCSTKFVKQLFVSNLGIL